MAAPPMHARYDSRMPARAVPPPSAGRCCVGIVTQDRAEDCLRAIEAVKHQDLPVRVIVFDNASRDRTPERVLERFPDVEMIRSTVSVGPTGGRNAILERVDSPYCFFMDDDAVPISTSTIRHAIDSLEQCERAAVAGSIVHEHGQVAWGVVDAKSLIAMQTFHGAGHAVRVARVREVGGYKQGLGIYNEESDLSLRLLAAGWVTIHANGSEVDHRKNPNRDVVGRARQRWRNEAIFKLQYCPTAMLLPSLMWQWRGMTRGHGLWSGSVEWLRALSAAWRIRREFARSPVSAKVHRAWLTLGREAGRGGLPVDDPVLNDLGVTMMTPRAAVLSDAHS